VMAQDMTAEPVARIMIPMGALLSRHLDSTSADGRVMGGGGLGFPASIKDIGGIFCLQFDRGEAKGLRRTAAYTVRPLLLITFKA